MNITFRNVKESDDSEWLMGVYVEIKNAPIKAGRKIFPDRPKGYSKAATNMAHYAANRAAALCCLRNSKPDDARKYFDICNMIESKLPTYAKQGV